MVIIMSGFIALAAPTPVEREEILCPNDDIIFIVEDPSGVKWQLPLKRGFLSDPRNFIIDEREETGKWEESLKMIGMVR